MYVQIAASLRSLVESGALPPGSLLPSEKQLCETFGVSRMTLRQAYDVLDREQLVRSQRGRGTQVLPPRIRKEQQQMRSFTEEIRSRGGNPRSQILRLETTDPSPASQQSLQLPAGQQVYRIERIRFNDTTPLAIEKVEIPCFLCPQLGRFDLMRHSLYEILESEFKLRLDHCVETISASGPNRKERELLQLPKGVAVLRIERKTLTVNDTLAELAVTTYRGDMYQAVVHSIRPPSRS
jgi:GntR family transcriptional regulator